MVGEGPEYARGDPRVVGDTCDGDLCLGVVVCDCGYDCLLHGLVLLGDPRSRLPGEARTYVKRYVVVAGELDRTEHQDAPAARRDLEHLLEADLGYTPRLGNDP